MPVRGSPLFSAVIGALLISGSATAATREWSGGSATTNNFSDSANWVGATPPIAGDSVRFPAGVPRLSPIDDFVGASNSFFVIGLQSGGYTLSGTGANTLVVSFVSNGAGTNSLAASLPLQLGVFGTGLATQTGSALTVNGPIDLNGRTLELNGGLNDLATGTNSDGRGTLFLNGVISGTGTVNGRFGIIRINAANTFTGTTAILNGALVYVNGALGPLNLVSGALLGIGSTGTVTASGGIVEPGDDAPGILNTGTLSMLSSKLLVEADGPAVGTQYDQLNVTGTVTLGGDVMLELVGAGVPIGTVLTIVNNDGNDAVSGTFTGLPEGAQVTLGDTLLSISYVGGTNANDVTLTAIELPIFSDGFEEL